MTDTRAKELYFPSYKETRNSSEKILRQISIPSNFQTPFGYKNYFIDAIIENTQLNIRELATNFWSAFSEKSSNIIQPEAEERFYRSKKLKVYFNCYFQ